MDMHDQLKGLYIFSFHNWSTFLEFVSMTWGPVRKSHVECNLI